jgi:acyl carrier protein
MSNTIQEIETTLRQVLRDHGKLSISTSKLGSDEDLYALGLSSLATVSLMLAIEANFDVEIPDEMLTRDNFRTLTALARLVQRLHGGSPS